MGAVRIKNGDLLSMDLYLSADFVQALGRLGPTRWVAWSLVDPVLGCPGSMEGLIDKWSNDWEEFMINVMGQYLPFCLDLQLHLKMFYLLDIQMIITLNFLNLAGGFSF